MSKTKIIAWIFGIVAVLFSLYGATALEISPSEAISDVYVNQPHDATITVKNTHPFEIFNITFSNNEFVTHPIIPHLGSNVSINHTFTILTDTSFPRTDFTSIVSFQYYVDIPQSPQSHNISITDSGYIPNDLTIYKDDTVYWKNNGTVTHSITCSKWDYALAVGAEQQITFSEVEEISYYDKYIFFTGYLHVKNRTLQELAHNSEYDKTFKIGLESKYHATNITLEITDDDNITMNWNGYTENMLKIKNEGTETAHHIVLSTNSNKFVFEFDEDDFSLNPDQTNYVTFTVRPDINRTVETNRTYNVSITLNSENAGGTEVKMAIYVPYHEFKENESISDWWEEMKEFCEDYPTSPHCISEPIIKEVNVTVNQTPKVSINFTEQQLQQLLLDIRKSTDTSERVENQWKQDQATNKARLDSLENTTTTTHSLVEQTKKDSDSRGIALTIIITGVVIAGSLGVMAYAHIQRKKRLSADSISGWKPKKTEGN